MLPYCSIPLCFLLYFSSKYLTTTWHISCALFVFCPLSPNLDTCPYRNHLLFATGPLNMMLALLEIFFSASSHFSLPSYLVNSFNCFNFSLNITSLRMPCLIHNSCICFLWLYKTVFLYIYRTHLYLILYTYWYMQLFGLILTSFLLNIMVSLCLAHNQHI